MLIMSTPNGINRKLLKLAVMFFTKDKQMFHITSIGTYLINHFRQVSSETIGWLAAICLHCATGPPLLGLMWGVSDKLPSVDVVLFLWAGLVLLFIKALVNKDMLNIITIGVGFIIQAGLLGLLVFK